MIEVNGAQGEGGGQILRTSLALSALTQSPIHIKQIRANRRQPGLRPQHLAAVNAIAKLTDAKVSGAHLNSDEITLSPRMLRPGRYAFDISTAGALTLVFQTLFFPLCFADGTSELTLTGGTHVPWSPVYHYLEEHWLPIMQRLGFRGQMTLKKAGFYPQGCGVVRASILPANELQPFSCVDRGELIRIRGLSGVANLDESIAKRQKHQALKRLYAYVKDLKIKTLILPSPEKGTFIKLSAAFSNGGCACFSALGAPGKPAERVADEAVDQLLAFLDSDGCIDPYLADQLLLPLSLINGTSEFRTNLVSQHLLTNASVIKQFLPVDIDIDGDPGQPGTVAVCGKPF